uniref:Uncharacterized protein n=1 Tax=Magallana gigas TaxID=29159 RepID=K1QCU5_MAGGI
MKSTEKKSYKRYDNWTGHCAEFNLGGATVQDNYDADCTKHDPPCPSSYSSAEAYKYGLDIWKR